jgi:hypothetical protein
MSLILLFLGLLLKFWAIKNHLYGGFLFGICSFNWRFSKKQRPRLQGHPETR